jgi:plasmid replication initiation protein
MTEQLKPITLPMGVGIRGRKITMSNALTRASHGLTLPEKRIIMMSVSQLNSLKIPSDHPLTRLSAIDYAEQFDLDTSTAYTQLADAAKTLFERKITFYVEAHNRKGEMLEPTKKQLRWVGGVHYNQGEGSISLEWHWGIVPHLIGLKKQFTTYQLQQASALRSIYSWKLLELLMRFEKTGWAEYTIEDFCESMGATEKQRANFGKIREKIINPAIKELTKKDGWEIELTTSKRGRRITRLRFDFKRDDQLSLNI